MRAAVRSGRFADYLVDVSLPYPITHRGCHERGDWAGWKGLTKARNKLQLVGDDLFVPTEDLPKASKRSSQRHPDQVNQIGTLTERCRYRDGEAALASTFRIVPN